MSMFNLSWQISIAAMLLVACVAGDMTAQTVRPKRTGLLGLPPSSNPANNPIEKLTEIRARLKNKLFQSTPAKIDVEADVRLRRVDDALRTERSLSQPARNEPRNQLRSGPNRTPDTTVPVQQVGFQQPQRDVPRGGANQLRGRPSDPYLDYDPAYQDYPDRRGAPSKQRFAPSQGSGNRSSFTQTGAESERVPADVLAWSDDEPWDDQEDNGEGNREPRFEHFSSRIPASERAIALENRLRKMLLENKALKQENETLKVQRQEDQRLLAEIRPAIDDAIDQLKVATESNQQLRGTVERLELDKSSLQRDYNYLLEKIDRELNDVLAREVSGGK